jgi:hypothetical protein
MVIYQEGVIAQVLKVVQHIIIWYNIKIGDDRKNNLYLLQIN